MKLFGFNLSIQRDHAVLGQFLLVGGPGRLVRRLEDLVGAAIFLASPAAAFLTGQTIYVDAGYSHVGMAFPEEEKGSG